MKPYSLDLRQKIIDVYENEPISQRQLAKRFGVALSFIEKLLKQKRQTGSITPKVRTEQTPTKLTTKQLAVLEQLVEDHNDATLVELAKLLEAKTGVRISRSTVDRMLKKLDLSVKKTLHASEKESERVQRARVAFWQMMQTILAKDLIFIDESYQIRLTHPRNDRSLGGPPMVVRQGFDVVLHRQQGTAAIAENSL
ncbi:transposase [Sphaerothrix gracilis]|uniref:transposase n=1 Tax=Sphaerothrix gracilis TaxID=3151835 RepID=UPI0031FE3841